MTEPTLAQLQARYDQIKAQGLSLDLTRGKPSSEQLALSDALDGILNNNYQSANGTDCRNYGGLDGIPEAKQRFATMLNVPADELIIGGNSSLTLMYQTALQGMFFGFGGQSCPWSTISKPVFICPVPGYDRHFSVCESLGIDMISVSMDENGPNMDEVESLLRENLNIRGMWCVPRFSNPSGIVYSDTVVDRIAQLGHIAHPDFRVFWDNAYAVHALQNDAPRLSSIYQRCQHHGTLESVVQFGSTSKITFAGAGIAFMHAGEQTRAAFTKQLSFSTIGPDKINQLRHVSFLPDDDTLHAHMQKHAAILKPKFDAVLDVLQAHFPNQDKLRWTTPNGGYFISVNTLPGLAKTTVALAADAGVKLTPAGATYPYKHDPNDSNIRIAPSFATAKEIKQATEVFAVCVALAHAKQTHQP